MKLLYHLAKRSARVLFLGGLLLGSNTVFGQFSQIISMDEVGNAYIASDAPFPFAVTQEPLSGMSTLRYTLPFAGVAGDVLVNRATTGARSEILRFDGLSHVWFFSDAADGVASLADVASLPSPISPNVAVLEQDGMAFYLPGVAQPGYKDAGPVSYLVFCQAVPEPSTLCLAALGGGLLLFLRSRKA